MKIINCFDPSSREFTHLSKRLDEITNRIMPSYGDLFKCSMIGRFYCVRMYFLPKEDRLTEVQLQALLDEFVKKPELKKSQIYDDDLGTIDLLYWSFENKEEMELKVLGYISEMHQLLDRLDNLRTFL